MPYWLAVVIVALIGGYWLLGVIVSIWQIGHGENHWQSWGLVASAVYVTILQVRHVRARRGR